MADDRPSNTGRTWMTAVLLLGVQACDFPTSENTTCALAQPDEAIPACTRAIESGSRPEEAYANRGMAYVRKGRLDEALADLTKAIELKPTLRGAYVARCFAYREKGDFGKALADCNTAVASEPGFADYYYNRDVAHALVNRGTVYISLHDADRAIRDFDQALEKSPQWLEPRRRATCLANRSMAWRMKADLEKAVEDGDRAVQADPEFASGYVQRGLARLGLEQDGLAREDFDRALEVDPGLATKLEAWIAEVRVPRDLGPVSP